MILSDIKFHIDYPDFTPINPSLCRQCGSECCDITTPFTASDIKIIKTKYRKALRGVKMVHSVGDAYMLEKRGNSQCVFLGDDKRCSIYEVRPEICRDFGDKPYCLCAYNGLSSIPTDKQKLKHLASEAQRKNTERLAAAMGVRVRADMVDPSVSNVLSLAFLQKTLDFRGEK